ncbi:MAG: glycosyltransferase family 2 protein [Phenylobacterium sp.]|nr:MAG: glycosyltransferase family 2 protein [Phenylobacterium sp.]
MRDAEGRVTDTPVVSVVTPTKNRLPLLREALDSVAAQTFARWEHLVVDDGSDDGTAEELARRAAADPRVRYIRRDGEKAGANICRNIGVRESRGEYVVFLDSDDLLDPQCLADRVALMARNADLDFATFQTSVFERTRGDLGRLYDPQLGGDHLLRFLYFEAPWIITAPIWRKTALLRLQLFDESLPSWQDVDLHIRALASGMTYLRRPEVDHHVRWLTEPDRVSIQQRRSPRHLEAAEAILEKFEAVVRSGPGMSWSRQRALCSLYFFVAENWVAAGHTSIGLKLWRQVRRRQLGSPLLHLTGATLLRTTGLRGPAGRLGARLAHKWKGWMHLRSEPELIRA